MGSDLKKDLQTWGCPLCDHLEDTIFAYFSRLQFDLFHDENIRKTLADEGGLCRFHTWQLVAFSSPRGLAKSLPPLLSQIANELLRIEDRGHAVSVEQAVSGEWNADCRVCSLLRKEEEAYATRLIEFLSREEGRLIYRASQGACLRHLGLLVKSIHHETARFLLRHAAHRLREMETHLKSYDQNLETGNRHDCLPVEKNVDRCALIHIAGAKTLSFPFG